MEGASEVRGVAVDGDRVRQILVVAAIHALQDRRDVGEQARQTPRVGRDRHLEEQRARIEPGLDVREVAVEQLLVATLERGARPAVGAVLTGVRRERERHQPQRRERDAQPPLLRAIRQSIELGADGRDTRESERPEG